MIDIRSGVSIFMSTEPQIKRFVISRRLSPLLQSSNTWCILLALIFVTLTLLNREARRRTAELKVEHNEVRGLRSTDLLKNRVDLRGSKSAKYTLIEFGDYECPPCRQSVAKVEKVLQQYTDSLQFDFRQFPLTDIHPNAQEAAVSAESARSSGKFWAVHKELFNADLSVSGSVQKILSANGVRKNLTAALSQIKEDKQFAERMNVQATPTFVLCCPSGRVIVLPTLDDVGIAMQQG